jgi:hypothetical protein
MPFGAGCRIRTDDLSLTRRLHYHCANPALFGGATETRTQKPAFTDRWISNPLQYHYGTAPKPLIESSTLYASLNSFTRVYCLLLWLHNV